MTRSSLRKNSRRVQSTKDRGYLGMRSLAGKTVRIVYRTILTERLVFSVCGHRINFSESVRSPFSHNRHEFQSILFTQACFSRSNDCRALFKWYVLKNDDSSNKCLGANCHKIHGVLQTIERNIYIFFLDFQCEITKS